MVKMNSSSSEDSDAGPKRKRKLRISSDSPASTSSGSPIIGNSSIRRRNGHTHRHSESSSEGSPILNSHRTKIRKLSKSPLDTSSDSDSPPHNRSNKHKQLISESDSDGDSTSQWESDFSDHEDETIPKNDVKPIVQNDSESELSDGQSEKCPICLVSFKVQEIGTPESCDHTFCLECIQEWSKNMNTCPVDRQEYSLILVRNHLNGKVIRQIPVERPTPQNDVDIFEDPTFCEICGSNDHEDRMLLCDGCDLGFHLFCLTPPLDDVPSGSWYCNDCGPESINYVEFNISFEEDGDVAEYHSSHRRSDRSTRLIPRTRQTERVRRRVENNRHQHSANQTNHNSPNGRTNRVTSSTSRNRSRATRVSRSRNARYRTVYVIDDVTGETVGVRKLVKKKRRRRRRRERSTIRPKTVKKRLAQQLGMCAPKLSQQNIPDVKVEHGPSTASGSISGSRYSAGIPTLHLFGQNNELDYFSNDEETYDLGSQLLTRRAPNRSDATLMRRTIRRKHVIVPEVVSSTSDLLGSILNCQEQLYAKNAVYSIDSSGKFKIEATPKPNKYVDVNKEQAKGKETPYYNPNRNYNNRYNNSNNNQNYNRPYQNRQRHYNNYYHNSHNNQNYHNTEPSSSEHYSNYNEDNDYPQDYSRRTLCATTDYPEENKEEQDEANQNDESEVDIYSDIETVTTTKAEEGEFKDYKPLSPPPIPNITGYTDDENDSESGMVIDDEKVQEQDNQAEYNIEETAVTSTVDYSVDFQPEHPNPAVSTLPITSGVVQSGAVQSSSLECIKTYQYYDDDGDESSDGCPNTNIYSKEAAKPHIEEDPESDDGCPNFSIYSKESKSMALHTVTMGSEKIDYHQVGEISSSPNIEMSQQEQLDDPNQLYDPEETFNETENLVDLDNTEQEQEIVKDYDPEKVYSPERDTASPALNYSYDPENCIRSDETLNTDIEKTFDTDQSYDPEVIYEENSNSSDKNVDIEKEIYKFKNDSNVEDRYDPALPFSDEIEDNNSQLDDKSDEKTEDVTTNEISMATSEIPIDESIINDTSTPVVTKTKKKKSSHLDRLYSDSEDDENVVKKDGNSFIMTDINHMTEDISEEERSYTPCLDEKSQKQGLEGLETEMISDEERNDFDESHELKTVSEGDALEINAKESEMDFTRPEDYEEGEIVDKNKDKESINEELEAEIEVDKAVNEPTVEVRKSKKPEKDKTTDSDKGVNKENEGINKEQSFKRLSKSSKDRNYRDKEKRPSNSRNKSNERDYNKKEKKKEKRKELERYNVRAIIAEKPRPLIAKDQFGRDIPNTPSRSRSRTYTPPPRSASHPVRSPSRTRRSRSRSRRSVSRRRSLSKDKSRKQRKSRNYRSLSRSRSPIKKGSTQKTKKRKRSSSRFRKRKSDDKPKSKRRLDSGNRRRSRSGTPIRRPRERVDWTPLSQPHMSPSWTPPRLMDNSQLLRNENLTVTVNNSNKKKKDKKKRADRRNKDTLENRQRKRRHERERTPPPSKEVFASGDNILVSVSFNNENETRDITTRDKKKNDENNKKRKKRKNRKDLSGVKPVAIIDLDRSPFRELTPSPKQIIVLTDSENEDNEMLRNGQSNICDSSQQVASPERGIGPKTPPEPQVKFSLAPKPPQIRAINNPLHDPEDIETTVQEELSSRISPAHKGPNTPPEPPNSPPSSPDAYDPFEPTKSRSPTPDLQMESTLQETHESIDSRAAIDMLEKSINPMPENNKSLTPPLADIQPADSQSSVQIVTPDSNIDKSPERSQIQTVPQTSKPVAQTTPFSIPIPIIASTPISTNLPPSRINILNSTMISPPVASPIPQRIVLPNQVKSSSVKISPTKATIKSTPIKPMPAKMNRVPKKRTQNVIGDDILLDFDSPYSPGSSDYEDLFEPPSEIVTKPVIKGKKSPQKHSSAFDTLFGSPSYNARQKKNKFAKKSTTPSKTKTVGVKLDEDNLKILDELPNSAVEMQVKDKFLKKLNRQERVVEEVKLVLKPHYNKKRINKEEYKDIMRRSVPKICHNKSGEINPTKIKNLIEAYVRKIRHNKKVTSSSSVNPQKL